MTVDLASVGLSRRGGGLLSRLQEEPHAELPLCPQGYQDQTSSSLGGSGGLGLGVGADWLGLSLSSQKVGS